MFYVYKYTSPSGKFYFGITDCKKRRSDEHKKKQNGAKDDNTKFANAIRKYGYDNFKYEILDEVPTLEEAKFKEINYIFEFDSIESGYNMTPGGDHCGTPKKLTKDSVKLIKKDLEDNILTYKQISQKYSIVLSMVNKIAKGKAWCHILGEETVNRSHLFEKGKDNSQAKLTDEQVIEIRKRLTNGESRAALMKEFDVSKTLVQMIATREAWNHLDDGYVYAPKELNGNAKLSPEVVAKLKKDLYNGMYRKDVAAKYGISKSAVDQICAGKTWREVEREQ